MDIIQLLDKMTKISNINYMYNSKYVIKFNKYK